MPMLNPSEARKIPTLANEADRPAARATPRVLLERAEQDDRQERQHAWRQGRQSARGVAERETAKLDHLQNPFATSARIRAGSVSPVERPISLVPLKTINVLWY
jgi:hypothetical protein